MNEDFQPRDDATPATFARALELAVTQIHSRLPAGACVWVAYSGGLDSSVLAHGLSARLPSVRLVHINHQLSPLAGQWQSHCERTARHWGLTLETVAVDVSPDGGGVEEAARQARFRAFASVLGPGDILLTAHHADDQAETLLFRAVRGSGLTGLSGVPPERSLTLENGGEALLLRPLLPVPRSQILAYARGQGLEWVEDDSNSDTRFDRNFLRTHCLPVLEDRWPGAGERMALSAGLLRQSLEVLERYLAVDLARCKPRDERLGSSLSITALKALAGDLQPLILRQWIAGLAMVPPGPVQLGELFKILDADEDTQPAVDWGDGDRGCSIRRYRQRLYALPRRSVPEPQELSWDLQSPLPLADGSQLLARPADTGLPPGQYRVRFRQGGERCQPEDRARSQTLKKLLQEYALEPWLRDRVPLVYRDSELVAVGDLWLQQGVARPGGRRMQWRMAQGGF